MRVCVNLCIFIHTYLHIYVLFCIFAIIKS
nr:MAG TPA: hypothetical protein [Caudoviricetes sp.]